MSRRFQFSLRALLVAITTGCLWLGWSVNRARVQMDVVTKLDGIAVFHYDVHPELADTEGSCLQQLLEAARWRSQQHFWHHLWYRARAVVVGIRIARFHTYDSPFGFEARPEEDLIERTIPLLQKLPSLEVVFLEEAVSDDIEGEIRAALPQCRITRIPVAVGFGEWED